MTTLTWLHLSDLHLRASGVETYNASVVLNKLLEDVSSHVARGLRPDLVFCTGDIAFSGREDEYMLAAAFFDRVLETIGHPGDKRRLFVVPGNHDVSWELITRSDEIRAKSLDSRDAVTEVLLSQESRRLFLRRLDNYAAFINSYFPREIVTFDDDHYFYVRSFEVGEGTERPQVAVLALNSAWVAHGGEEDKVIVGELQAQEALSNPMTANADVRIALLHHPFEQLRNFDCEDTRRLLEQKSDFILVGHRHKQRIQGIEEPDRDFVLVPAGAAYQGRENQETNAYNVMQLNLTTGQGTLYLREYSPEAGRWVDDTRTYGQGHFSFSLPRRLTPPTLIQRTYTAQASGALIWLTDYLADGVALVLEASVVKVTRSQVEPLYDRDKEVGLFRRILHRKDLTRAVVIHSRGEPGWGKSSLLMMFCQECSQCEPSFARTLLFLAHDVPVSWVGILNCTAQVLGRECFPKFSAFLRSFEYSKAGRRATWEAQAGYSATGRSGPDSRASDTHVAEGLTHPAPTDLSPENFQQLLTDTFLEELQTLSEPAQVVWMIDTLEAVEPETQAWLAGMLGRIARRETSRIILVVAGQNRLPYDQSWKSGICEMDLKGLPRDAIRQLAQSRGMQGSKRTLGILVELLEARTLGNPLGICTLLDGE